MSAPLRVGVIGVGHLGRHHARLLGTMPGVQLVGVVDSSEARAHEIAAASNTAAFTDPRALDGRVDAVTVAVPTEGHLDVALGFIERGVHVLVEKPIARTVAEADRMVAAAAARGVRLAVGHTERFNPAVEAARSLLRSPRFIEAHRLGTFPERSLDIDVVFDLMIHDLDLVLYLTGGQEATEVRASGLSVLSPHLDIANARVEFANGAVALATASRVSRDRVRKLRLFQPNGYLSLDLASGAGEFMRLRPDWQPGTGAQLADVVERVVLEAPEADALRLELQSFVHSVRGERAVVVSGEQGRAALALALRVAAAVRTTPLAAPAAG